MVPRALPARNYRAILSVRTGNTAGVPHVSPLAVTVPRLLARNTNASIPQITSFPGEYRAGPQLSHKGF